MINRKLFRERHPSGGLRVLALAAIAAAVLVSALLVAKSVIDFTRTGPAIQQEIEAHFFGYAVYATGRLGLWAFAISAWLAGFGVLAYGALCTTMQRRARGWEAFIAAGVAIGAGTVYQFLHQLYYLPGGIVASWLYRISRLYPIWDQLSPERLRLIAAILVLLVALPIVLALWRLARKRRPARAFGIALAALALALPLAPLPDRPEGSLARARSIADERLNIVMIGSDTLRADRLGALGYARSTTPAIDRLAMRATVFADAYVPIARTAPSLVSLLTGTWPQTHGVRANFTLPSELRPDLPGLPSILAEAGYRTEAITDWAGGDLGKYPLGFQHYLGPEDQWNLKFLIRQGPKDLRLYLSLFTHNEFGRRFLPEVYYLAGIPMGSEIVRQSRSRLRALAAGEQPFLLTVFTSATHAPFGSEHPYYRLFADPNYRGESRFAMSGLVNIRDIIEAQGRGAESFDVRQVENLYDGAVRNFDAIVEGLLTEIERLGIAERTLLVIFSDHGVELFEKGSWGQGNGVLGKDPSARVPMLIADPRRSTGRIVRRTTRTIDLAPTLLELVGISPPSSMEGTSLLPYIDDPESDLGLTAFHETGVWLTGRPDLKSNHLRYPSLLEILGVPDKEAGTIAIRPDYRNRVIEARDRMVRTDRWKLVYLPMVEGAVWWLFNVDNDPDAERDVAAEHPAVVADLRARLIAWQLLDKDRAWVGEHFVANAGNSQ